MKTLYLLNLLHLPFTLACGPLTHEMISHEASYYATTLSNSTLLASLASLKWRPYLQAGTYFPDFGYQCLDPLASEEAHWQPFWKAAIAHLKENYPDRSDPNAMALMAFLLGVISHDVSDVLWHSLGMEQGFIDAMKWNDFNGNTGKAHLIADLGGDFALSRFGKSHSYLSESWGLPTNDIIAIYKRLRFTVTSTQLNLCIKAGFTFMQAEKTFGKFIFPRLASYTPFLSENYFSYFRGGVDNMAASSYECWQQAVGWFEAGEVNTECNHMGEHNKNESGNRNCSTSEILLPLLLLP